MRVIVCGDRNWDDANMIYAYLRQLPEGTTIIEGDCRGADKLAGRAARECGHELVVVPADWKRYGRGAGPIRNLAMIRDHGPIDRVIAFHDDFASSRGTRHMIGLAHEWQIPTEIKSHTEAHNEGA